VAEQLKEFKNFWKVPYWWPELLSPTSEFPMDGFVRKNSVTLYAEY